MKKKFLFLSIPLLFFLFFFFDLAPTLGGVPRCVDGETRDCGTCGVQICVGGSWGKCQETPKPHTSETDSRNEYRCQGEGCGKEYIERRLCSRFKTRTCSCITNEWRWTCTEWSGWSAWSCGTATNIESCAKSWQRCQRKGTNPREWLRQRPQCLCAGECLTKPKNPRLLDWQKKEVSPTNVLLPVKLDWEDVEQSQSYLIQANNLQAKIRIKAQKKDYTVVSEAVLVPCSFKSNFNNSWKVVPCCGANGTNCKPWKDVSRWSFTTNLAPELVSPYDPDWQGPEKAQNIPIPVVLDWCEVKEANFYELKVYLIENDEKICHPRFTATENGQTICHSRRLRPEMRENDRRPILYSDFLDKKEGFFTKDTCYEWQIGTYVLERGVVTVKFSPSWFFCATGVLAKPILFSPADDPAGKWATSVPVVLDWSGVFGSRSYRYRIIPIDKGKKISEFVLGDGEVIEYPDISLDAKYTWQVVPCWDNKGKECQEESWSDIWHFRTTGAPPKLISPKPNAIEEPIPIRMDWENVSGAGSYKYEIYYQGELIIDGFTNKDISEVFIDYDVELKHPRQETKYSWQIYTCAVDKERKKICGKGSEKRTLTTFKLSLPINPFPEDHKKIYTYQMPKPFSWDPVLGAKYYELAINYTRSPEEKDIKNCPEGKIKEEIIPENSELINFHCLGTYQWQVRACLDENCQEVGSPAVWNFVLAAKEAPEGFWAGLVPCGRDFDIPFHITPWDETKPCGIEHIFLLIQRIINFALWTIAPLALVLLTVYTGVMFYLSLSTGTSEALIKIKSLWKSAGLGFGIIFFAWIIISFILTLFGYRVGVFGPWWRI